MTVSTSLPSPQASTLDVPPRLPVAAHAVAAHNERVLELVQRRLRDSSYYYLRTINCAFADGVLTLRGRVPSFFLKQTVQVLAEKVDGVHQVINLVDVTYPADAVVA